MALGLTCVFSSTEKKRIYMKTCLCLCLRLEQQQQLCEGAKSLLDVWHVAEM